MAQTIDAPRSQLDKTVRIFDQFYNFDIYVDGGEYDIIYSFFYSTSNSKNIAKNFTSMIYRIANITKEKPLTLLEYIQGKNKIETNALMIYYLNSLKSKTTLYGINVEPQPNQTVQRNVVI
jgi:hypothetical protein